MEEQNFSPPGKSLEQSWTRLLPRPALNADELVVSYVYGIRIVYPKPQIPLRNGQQLPEAIVKGLVDPSSTSFKAEAFLGRISSGACINPVPNTNLMPGILWREIQLHGRSPRNESQRKKKDTGGDRGANKDDRDVGVGEDFPNKSAKAPHPTPERL